ncbi:MAG TPA: polyprenyl synthetase family protein [Verrucomicrobiae bacterium]|nr:polyprenyl synthetase family protein [Verrucomicrobiae bacterium]
MEPVEPFLEAVASQLLDQVTAFDPEIAPYAQYALASQGKQLRPALVGLSGMCVGELNHNSATVAVIIEMVHLATLVHDDIMDEAEMRRCRPTLAANWGSEISVLLGDCLFAHALKMSASFPTPEICRSVASATNTVCSGEILQNHRCLNFDMPRADYFKVIGMKTAELFALSCDLGSWLSGAAPAERAALRQYGQALGTAYQIYDDCVDVFGTERVAGKSLGTDLANGKLTLPVLVALERGDTNERARLRDLISSWKPANLLPVVAILERCDALGESRRIIQQYLNTARHALSVLPESEGRQALAALAGFLARQTETMGASAS